MTKIIYTPANAVNCAAGRGVPNSQSTHKDLHQAGHVSAQQGYPASFNLSGRGHVPPSGAPRARFPQCDVNKNGNLEISGCASVAPN